MAEPAEKVVGLNGIVPAGQRPVKSVVELLEHLLSEAQSGRINGIAVATVRIANVTTYAWNGECPMSLLVAAETRLHFQLLHSDMEDEG